MRGKYGFACDGGHRNIIGTRYVALVVVVLVRMVVDSESAVMPVPHQCTAPETGAYSLASVAARKDGEDKHTPQDMMAQAISS